VEEIVIVVAAVRLGTKESDLEWPESDGVGVVTRVEVVEEVKTEASMVSESLSSATDVVEEAEEDGRDWSVDGAGEGTGSMAGLGVWNSSSEVASLSVSSTRVKGEGFMGDLSLEKMDLIEWGSFGIGSS
jgi:hypothetical protein